MKNIRRTFLSLTATTGVALSALMVPQVVFGQEEQAVESETILDEVIVTANRREQSIQDVSGVVQTLSADALREGGITEFRQLQVAVPGLSIANQEGNVEIFIRGVGSANNTELGDPGAAPHLNGVYIPRP
ncbi:MAG: TonB-dependent receptor plug domain-containing protein, partial [Gammaproteobacteria bacterium]|nr:TonB-dependent receptor plug domain-containing protein [Gammaproteobacteria bacterium]